MRPTSLAEFVGQSHLLAKGRPLYCALESGHLHSMILWGAPGTGKTSLAELITQQANAHLERLSAVSSGAKEIRDILQLAFARKAQGKRTVLFVDEVHRFNKSQQDLFLPYIEDGTITFIGATTENPSFELNHALLSRARVYKLQLLESEEIVALLCRALSDPVRGVGAQAIDFPLPLCQALAQFVAGDARLALNYLEALCDHIVPAADGSKRVSAEDLAQVLGEKVARFDQQGDQWYDLISAFHKSVRGSAPDAALYWYARIVTAGGDPLYVARRLVAIASEDIGLADPKAMQVVLAAWDAFLRVGAAEGERAIAQAVIYLACAPKSNATLIAWEKALHDARTYAGEEVPLHLRNAPTALMKELGYGKSYRYAHDEPHAYAAGESYFPPNLTGTRYYEPTSRGLESKLAEKLDFLLRLDQACVQKR
ncbi:MAG: replication-associated recombination protein A [Vibrionaceae bacterium]